MRFIACHTCKKHDNTASTQVTAIEEHSETFK